MKKYFTRLTPNVNGWKKPSGREGKCSSNKSSDSLYEQYNHFGWEEWLFHDYYVGKEKCVGFLQAFNGKNKNVKSVDEIHLYTRICDSRNPKHLYLGYIKEVEVLPVDQRATSTEQKESKFDDLMDVNITDFPRWDSMWENCYNIQFERKNVFLLKAPREITLGREQFRFALYDLNKHLNFSNQINF